MKKDKTYILYIHTNKTNGKKYVGITSTTTKRRWANGHGYKGQIFYNAIKKYGWDNFDHEVVVSGLSEVEADYWEKLYISKLNTQSPNGYNVTQGGDAKSMDRSQLVGEKATNIKPLICLTTMEIFPYQKLALDKYGIFSASLTACVNGRGNYAGKEENGNKLMWAHYDETKDESYYTALREEKINRIRNHGNKGRKPKESMLRKISKPVICLTTGKTYYSTKEAERQTKVDDGSIRRCCIGKAKYAGRDCNGKELVWRYLEDYNENKEVI